MPCSTGKLSQADVDFLRQRITLHTNAVKVGGNFAVGSLKSNKNRKVVLPAFVLDALAETANGFASAGSVLLRCWDALSCGNARARGDG